MKTTLICTVGGSHEPIVKAIQALKPDHVCFVCSGDDPATGNKGSYTQITGKGNVIKANFGDDKPTLPNIPAQVDLQEDQFAVLRVQPDSLDDIYRALVDWLRTRERDAERIVADYTGGTKTMSAALVAFALDEGIELQLVSGSRSNLVKVESGAEYVMPAAVEQSRFRRQLERAMDAWERHAYDETAFLLENIQPPADPALRGEYERAIDISRAFAAWDRFDHVSAQRVLSRYRPRLGRHWGPLLGALDMMLKEGRGEPLRLFDLWRNAERRATQGRYDDAVARIYRLLEWSAQWILQSAGIETKDVPPEKIPAGVALTKNREGKYQAGLFAAWTLAAVYGGEVVAEFWRSQKESMLDLLQSRNHSILAHGFEPISDNEWQDFARWAEEKLLPLLLAISANDPWRIKELPPQLPRWLEASE